MEEVNLEYSRVEIGSDYAIIRTQEGADIEVEHHLGVIHEIENRIQGNYGLIFDEIHSHSMRFGTLVEIRKNLRLTCIAIVAYRSNTVELASVTANSINKPLQVFHSLPKAVEWVRAQLNPQCPH